MQTNRLGFAEMRGSRVHARLRVTQRLESPPATVMARVHAAPVAQLGAVENRRVPVLLRLPILIPMSLAAGVLLFVGTHALLSPPQRVLMRAVQMQRAIHEAPVRALPSAQAPIVGRITGGEMVDVRAEQSDWYRIALPDGSEGWIEAGALR